MKNKRKKLPEPGTKIYFLYRDASNYKFNGSIDVSAETIGKIEFHNGHRLRVGDEILYDTHLGMTPKQFHERFIGYSPGEDDHNILEVTGIRRNIVTQIREP